MELSDIARLRLRNQLLTGPPAESPVAAVGALGAVQAQDYGPARWSVGQRTSMVDEGTVEASLAAGAILRIHLLRPTWHFVAAEDLPWVLALTSPRVHVQNRTYYERFELDAPTLGRSGETLRRILEGGRHLTRPEIAAQLEAVGIGAERMRLVYILQHAELEGVICSGPRRGNQQTYALVSERVPAARILEGDAALIELTRLFFSSRGPATERDFRWWSSLYAADIGRALEMLAGELERIFVDDVAYWFSQPPSTVRDASPVVHLLQPWDEYVVAYSESRWAADVAGIATGLRAGEPVFFSSVVCDGQVVGQWRRPARSPTVEVALYRALDGEEADALKEAVAEYGRYLGVDVTLQTRPI